MAKQLEYFADTSNVIDLDVISLVAFVLILATSNLVWPATVFDFHGHCFNYRRPDAGFDCHREQLYYSSISSASFLPFD